MTLDMYVTENRKSAINRKEIQQKTGSGILTTGNRKEHTF